MLDLDNTSQGLTLKDRTGVLFHPNREKIFERLRADLDESPNFNCYLDIISDGCEEVGYRYNVEFSEFDFHMLSQGDNRGVFIRPSIPEKLQEMLDQRKGYTKATFGTAALGLGSVYFAPGLGIFLGVVACGLGFKIGSIQNNLDEKSKNYNLLNIPYVDGIDALAVLEDRIGYDYLDTESELWEQSYVRD